MNRARALSAGADSALRLLADAKLLPVYSGGANTDSAVVISQDLDELLLLAEACAMQSGSRIPDTFFEGTNALPDSIVCRDGSKIPLRDGLDGSDSLAFRPAVRALLGATIARNDGADSVRQAYLYFGGTCVETASPAVGNLAVRQREQAAVIDDEGRSDFARSAHYMGSKRRLGSFLVEALSSSLDPSGLVLDLMCGSGAATGAFAKKWRTFASDAQQFCRLLSLIQGGGYSHSQAEESLRRLLPIARQHAEVLRQRVHPWVQMEDDLLHCDVETPLLERYQTFLHEFPVYPETARTGDWSPLKEVDQRRADPTSTPHCLFTAYFANIYFGVRQAIEIDSLRSAIEQLEPPDRNWALGALIVAASAQATTYAAHFAQPPIADPQKLKLGQLARILERRAGSIYHEFSARLLGLARQSETSAHAVRLLDGPWEEALAQFEALEPECSKAVYLDAPYTREEYSRYYHVLETLVTYNYPSVVGRGRTPTRGKDRFVSELFTRSQLKMEDRLARIIAQVLRRGWICAWSYSDAGVANIPTVLQKVEAIVPSCKIRSFAVPFQHKSQGPRSHKQVTEYVLVISPRG